MQELLATAGLLFVAITDLFITVGSDGNLTSIL